MQMEDKRILICNVLLPGNVAMRDGSPVVYIDNDYNGNEELLFEKQFIELLKDNNVFSTVNYTGSKLVIMVCSLEQVIEKTILDIQDIYTVSKLYQIGVNPNLDYVDQVVKLLYNKVYPSLEYSFGSYKECLEYLYK